jgi:putative ABC transport system ATP-binding protein
MIEFYDIHLAYPNGTVFDRLSFTLKKGKISCISGPSGSGKSSILKLIQGYLTPDKGEITIEGTPLNRQTTKDLRLKMAYIPQNINLPVTSGSELANLLGVKVYPDKINQLLAKLGMPNQMLERPFDEMSGGQKQRVVIALCLSLGREIILLDEPTAALDDESIEQLLKVIRGLKDTTVISASHNPEWIKAMDQVIQL